MSKRRKIRIDLRKNRENRTRTNDLTRSHTEDAVQDSAAAERIRARGNLSRKRTIITDSDPSLDRNDNPSPVVDPSECHSGRVVRIHGLESIVAADDGRNYRCGVRRLLKSMAIDERSVVAVGDRVLFRKSGLEQGMIERIEPRKGVIVRGYRRRAHVIAANVDRLIIVASLADPPFKPALIDRYLISAEMGAVPAIIVLNKADLVDLADFQWVIGLYSQLGYEVLITSARAPQGLDRLKELLASGTTAVSGQSGVGKSSLLNAVEPGLGLRVGEVSDWTRKGKHTTTFAELLHLQLGGDVVDTPGLRQFELWGLELGQIEGFFIEFRPYVSNCRFHDCTHTREIQCAVLEAVVLGQIHEGRYRSYLKLYEKQPLDED